MGQSHSVRRADGSEGTEEESHGNTVQEEEEEVAGIREGGVMRRFRRWRAARAARAARKESEER